LPNPGTRRIKYLEENVAAADIAITEDELKALDAAAYVSSIEAPNSNIVGGGATGVILEA
jgi:aryl-alcohol dehydrogenase-like predicted oxidoreductase